MLKVVVLVSGGGTNLQAIIDGVKGGVIRNTKIVNPGMCLMKNFWKPSTSTNRI